MELNIKHLLAASLIVCACLGTDASAKNWGRDGDMLNQLVNAGIISPQQADQISSREGGNGWNGYGRNNSIYLGTFGFGANNPSHYDSNLINNSARNLDKLHGDHLISDYELNALKSQLTARVKLVNENAGITTNGGYRNGFPNGYPNGTGVVDPTGGYRPRGMYNPHQNPHPRPNWRNN